MIRSGRYIFLLLSLCFGVASAIAQQGKSPAIPLSGVYEYVYEHNTKDLIENHYLEFRNANGKIEGYYYGTSDDFDEAREGYLPGFFSARMKNLLVQGASISFEVEVKNTDFFSRPVTPLNKTEKNTPWGVGIRYATRAYHGEIKGDSILIKTKGFKERVFRKLH
ncbi:MAG TPA: hypothetical protein VN604_02790 [Nitrospirota bacterium]|nr:hypothetical protein [Nitrospirota bacterium]